MRLLPPSSRALALDQTGNYAFLGGTDGSACIYSFPKQETVRMFDVGDSAINDLISLESGSGLRCAAASADGSVRIFENDTNIDEYSAHFGNVSALSAHPAGELIASVGEDKSFVMYSIIQKKVLSQVYTDSGKITNARHLRCVSDRAIKYFHAASSIQTATCSEPVVQADRSWYLT